MAEENNERVAPSGKVMTIETNPSGEVMTVETNSSREVMTIETNPSGDAKSEVPPRFDEVMAEQASSPVRQTFLQRRFGLYDKIKLPVIVLDIVIVVSSILLVLAFVFGRDPK